MSHAGWTALALRPSLRRWHVDNQPDGSRFPRVARNREAYALSWFMTSCFIIIRKRNTYIVFKVAGTSPDNSALSFIPGMDWSWILLQNLYIGTLLYRWPDDVDVVRQALAVRGNMARRFYRCTDQVKVLVLLFAWQVCRSNTPKDRWKSHPIE